MCLCKNATHCFVATLCKHEYLTQSELCYLERERGRERQREIESQRERERERGRKKEIEREKKRRLVYQALKTQFETNIEKRQRKRETRKRNNSI